MNCGLLGISRNVIGRHVSSQRVFMLPFLVCLVAVLCSAASAEDSVVWGDPVAVDTGVIALPGSTGQCVQWLNGQLWVFYEKSGDIYGAPHGLHGWAPPRRFTTNPARQSNPHVFGYQVIWEDWRGAVPEIRVARFDGMTWSGEMALSPDDGVPSRYGSIGGGYSGDMAAWEDSTATGFRVYGRRYTGETWLPVEAISIGTGSQRDPSVSGGWGLCISWADYRHGDPEIYERFFYNGAWGQERRLTDLPYPCRHPSLVVQPYGDVYEEAMVSFESTGSSGAAEAFVHRGTDTVQISPDDGVPSVRPSTTAFSYSVVTCNNMPWSSNAQYVTWTDLNPDQTRSHFVWGRSGIDETPGRGIATSIVAAQRGSPRADLVQFWIERRSEILTLMSRFGTTVGCYEVGIDAPPALLLGPEGVPDNLVRSTNTCSGELWADVGLSLALDNLFTDSFTWDPAHPPQPWYDFTTDERGEARIPLFGGGCSVTPGASVECPFAGSHGYVGGKSPDVNGDCWVKPEDLAYVQSKLGTSDFCADLDMSGTVGPEDVAIVEMTLWDHCTNVTDAEGIGADVAPKLFAYPNPARDSVRLHIARPGDDAAVITIFDAAGRLVRALTAHRGERIVSWDLRSDAGRRIAGGIYFAVADVAGKRLSRTVMVLR